MNDFLHNILSNSIGYEPLESWAGRQQPSFPKYNIVKKSEYAYSVELALAGIKKNDITIDVKDNKLNISSTIGKHINEKEPEYLHKGISSRNFSLSFALGNYMEVTEAKMEDGILSIELERIVPEEKKAKLITIS